MDQALQALVSLEFFVFSCIVAMLVFGIRKIVEFSFEKFNNLTPESFDIKVSKIWREVILPILPLVIGGTIAYFVSNYPYPESFKDSDLGRIGWGILGGLASAYVYPRVISFIRIMTPTASDETIKSLTGQDPEQK